jgi:hypothetical protein
MSNLPKTRREKRPDSIRTRTRKFVRAEISKTKYSASFSHGLGRQVLLAALIGLGGSIAYIHFLY